MSVSIQQDTPTSFHPGGGKERGCLPNLAFASCSQIMTNNDQQQLYENTAMVLSWLQCKVAGNMAVQIIGGVLVGLANCL